MKAILIFIFILIHATFEFAISQQIDCIRLQSNIDSLILKSGKYNKGYMGRNLFDDPFTIWRAGKIITKKNDTLVGNILLKVQSQYTRLPTRVKLEDSSGKRKTYSAKKISKFNRGEKEYVTLEFDGYHYFAQKVYTDNIDIYYGKYVEPDLKYNAASSFFTPGPVYPTQSLIKDVFYFEIDNKILGPIMSDNLDSFIKYTCVCNIKFDKSDINIYDIYLFLVYLNSQIK